MNVVSDKLREGGHREHGWCSWCFKPTVHTATLYYKLSAHTNKVRFRRDVYQCDDCKSRTVPCMKGGCHEFARSYAHVLSDKFCYVHQGLLPEWTEEGRAQLSLRSKYCSWCLERTDHVLVHASRRMYECSSCGKPTKPCKRSGKSTSAATPNTCEDDGMARDGALGGGACLKHAKLLKDWGSVEDNKKSLQREAWCSWCSEHCTHTLVAKNKIKRNEYTCDTCTSPTMGCIKCKDGMSRSGPSNPHCIQCKGKNKWEELLQRKYEAFGRDNDIEYIRKELERESEHRAKALEDGLIRPFLLLVSMHPAARCMTAAALEINMFSAKDYGDPHAEAAKILFTNKKGIKARSTYRRETVTKRSCAWYDLLFRLNKETFKVQDIERLLASEAEKLSGNSEDRTAQQVEMKLMDVLAKSQRARMTETQKSDVDKLMDADPIVELLENLDAAGISDPSLKRWLVETCYLASPYGAKVGKQEGAETPSHISRKLKEEDIDEEDRAGGPSSGSDSEGEIDGGSALESQEDIAALASRLVSNLHQQVVQGQGYFAKMRKRNEVLGAVGAQAATMAVVIPLNLLVISPACPPLGILITAGMITNAITSKLFSSDIPSLFSPICQLLVHYLFISSQGINIHDFY
ncbi:Transcription initiation factor TFIID subunit 1 [Balamuthia mandrillaris]